MLKDSAANKNRIYFSSRPERKQSVFYIKMGYQTKGLPFEVKGVGEHIIMFKAISDE